MNWKYYNGLSVRFVSIYQGVEDYEVYDKGDNSFTTISYDNNTATWRGFCGDLDPQKYDAVKSFIAAKNAENLAWLEQRGFDVPDRVIHDPRLTA